MEFIFGPKKQNVITVPYFNNINLLDNRIHIVKEGDSESYFVILNELGSKEVKNPIKTTIKGVYDFQLKDCIELVIKNNSDIIIERIKYYKELKELVFIADKELDLTLFEEFRNSNVYFKEDELVDKIINGVTFLEEYESFDTKNRCINLKQIKDIYDALNEIAHSTSVGFSFYLRKKSVYSIFDLKEEECFPKFELLEEEDVNKLYFNIIKEKGSKSGENAKISYLIEKKDDNYYINQNFTEEMFEEFADTNLIQEYNTKFWRWFHNTFSDFMIKDYEFLCNMAALSTNFKPISIMNYEGNIFIESGIIRIETNNYTIYLSNQGRITFMTKNNVVVELTEEEKKAFLQNTIVDLHKCPLFIKNEVSKLKKQKKSEEEIQSPQKKRLIKFKR